MTFHKAEKICRRLYNAIWLGIGLAIGYHSLRVLLVAVALSGMALVILYWGYRVDRKRLVESWMQKPIDELLQASGPRSNVLSMPRRKR